MNGEGQDNWFLAPPNFKPSGRLVVRVSGGAHRNIIVFGSKTNVNGSIQIHGSNNLVIIGDQISQSSQLTIWLWGSCGLIFWGCGSTSNGTTINIQGESGRIIIGDDCMFAKNTNVRDSDMHAILDMRSGDWLNQPSNVLIEPHVWIAEDAWIMKGSRVGFGSIVGGKSYVSGEIPRFSSSAGIPAKIIRTGVSWDRNMKPSIETVARLRDIEQKLSHF